MPAIDVTIDREKVRTLCSLVSERLDTVHVGCFKGMDKPILLISDAYPGIWLEHVYDSVIYARLRPERLPLAVNTIRLFMEKQKEDGQYPACILNGDKVDRPEDKLVSYSQIQECVSFAQLSLEVCQMSNDRTLLEAVYASASKWENWLRTHRMTMDKGLIEMFVGFDTGHDESGRLEGLSCPGNYTVRGERMNAAHLPPEDGITPILAVDMNANFYATERALASMADLLGRADEASHWRRLAHDVKRRLFELCFNEEDCFFYDVDKNGRQRKYLSSTIFHLFLEKVLDPKEDAALIDQLYTRYIKNPRMFWTPYPFPSMAIADPSWKKHKDSNCWGYFSEALIALRGTRWMDDYGMNDDFDALCAIWLKAWTDCFDTIKFGQELDPITGCPSSASEWYSSCMLFYLYAAKRLGVYSL